VGYFLMVGVYFHGSSLSFSTRQTAHFSIPLAHLKMQIRTHESLKYISGRKYDSVQLMFDR